MDLFKSKLAVQLLPIALTVFLIFWTILVSPYSKYGDYWAILPALAVLPLVMLLHVVFVFMYEPKMPMMIYGVAHIAILVIIWMWSLILISKDSL